MGSTLPQASHMKNLKLVPDDELLAPAVRNQLQGARSLGFGEIADSAGFYIVLVHGFAADWRIWIDR